MLTALLFFTIALEILLFTHQLWRIRLWVIGGLCFLIPGSVVLLTFNAPSWISLAVGLVAVSRLGNLLRIAEKRMHEKHLYHATRRTTFYFCGAQVITLGLLYQPVTGISWYNGILALAVVQLLVAGTLAAITYRTIHKTTYHQATNFFSDKELPSVSVLIPARNETFDLEECLRTILLSDYPKLEIIVLDDCSHVQTSDIIKKFAHDGVRFIKGEEPSSQWLAKNLAYERLREASSGELLLFCGVDTRFGPHTIRALVTDLLSRNKDMISVIPRRLSGELSSAFLQPIRYWWELALPRKLLKRPAVLSTCWLIRAKVLDSLGGFAGTARSIIPERQLARTLAARNTYSFLRANDTLDVNTMKSFHEQQATAIRVKYPQLSKRPELLIALVLLEIILLLGPFGVLVYSIFSQSLLVTAISLCAITLHIITHVSIVYITNPPNSIIALWNFPIAVLSEIIVSITSMLRYEFGEVLWKDRNICIPVMHVVPRLPKIQDTERHAR